MYQHANATYSPNLSEDENALLQHVSMWGSEGYPVEKRGSRWVWQDWRSVKGSPKAYKTKREATAAFEAWHSLALDRIAGRI